MKTIITAFLMMWLSITDTPLYGQTDDNNIQQARMALDIQHNCDSALWYLGLVSTDGKTKMNYNLQMGRANDCKTNVAQAIYYYNKFLEFQPGNDSLKRRVAELSDDKAQQARVANEERIARSLSMSGGARTKKGKKKHLDIEDMYFCLGMGYGNATGGSDAPYKKTLEFNADYGFPLVKHKLLLELCFNADILIQPSSNWLSGAFEVPSSQIEGLTGGGINYNIHFALMPVLLNKKNIAMAIGPLAGIGFTSLPDMEYYSFETTKSICPYYGLRTNLFLGEFAVIYLQYGQMGAKTATADLPAGVTNTVAENQGMLVFGVRLRLNAWGRNMWW